MGSTRLGALQKKHCNLNRVRSNLSRAIGVPPTQLWPQTGTKTVLCCRNKSRKRLTTDLVVDGTKSLWLRGSPVPSTVETFVGCGEWQTHGRMEMEMSSIVLYWLWLFFWLQESVFKTVRSHGCVGGTPTAL